MTEHLALVLCRKCEQYFNRPLGETRCSVCNAPVQLMDARHQTARESRERLEKLEREVYHLLRSK